MDTYSIIHTLYYKEKDKLIKVPDEHINQLYAQSTLEEDVDFSTKSAIVFYMLNNSDDFVLVEEDLFNNTKSKVNDIFNKTI